MRLAITLILAAQSVLTFASSIKSAQTTTINFDTDGNWTLAGSSGSYLNHGYNESGWCFNGTEVIRNGASAQDGVAGALGAYSWRLRNNTGTSIVGTYSQGGALAAFGFDVRRWDSSPDTSFILEISTDGGATFAATGDVFNSTFLDSSSAWKTFTYHFAKTTSFDPGAFKFRLRATKTTERLFIDNFFFTFGEPRAPDSEIIGGGFTVNINDEGFDVEGHDGETRVLVHGDMGYKDHSGCEDEE